jgi:hypothetical protein
MNKLTASLAGTAVTATATVALALSAALPAQAMPAPEKVATPTAAVGSVFGPGHAPVAHVAGRDWLPARR